VLVLARPGEGAVLVRLAVIGWLDIDPVVATPGWSTLVTRASQIEAERHAVLVGLYRPGDEPTEEQATAAIERAEASRAHATAVVA
jgi:hypothetical protein